MTSWMRENAPWQDLSGAARKALRAEVIRRTGVARYDDPKWVKAKEREADELDQETLDEINRQRAAKNQIRIDKLPLRKQVPREWRYNRPITSIRASHTRVSQLPYTLWLEIGMGGRFSIIGPTIDYWGPRFMAAVQRMLNLGTISEADLAGFHRATFVRGARGNRRYQRPKSYLEQKIDPRTKRRMPGRRRRKGRGRPQRNPDYNQVFHTGQGSLMEDVR